MEEFAKDVPKIISDSNSFALSAEGRSIRWYFTRLQRMENSNRLKK